MIVLFEEKLICIFVFPYAKIRFSHNVDEFIVKYGVIVLRLAMIYEIHSLKKLEKWNCFGLI